MNLREYVSELVEEAINKKKQPLQRYSYSYDSGLGFDYLQPNPLNINLTKLEKVTNKPFNQNNKGFHYPNIHMFLDSSYMLSDPAYDVKYISDKPKVQNAIRTIHKEYADKTIFVISYRNKFYPRTDAFVLVVDKETKKYVAKYYVTGTGKAINISKVINIPRLNTNMLLKKGISKFLDDMEASEKGEFLNPVKYYQLLDDYDDYINEAEEFGETDPISFEKFLFEVGHSEYLDFEG
jgi:hypothetical protein